MNEKRDREHCTHRAVQKRIHQKEDEELCIRNPNAVVYPPKGEGTNHDIRAVVIHLDDTTTTLTTMMRTRWFELVALHTHAQFFVFGSC